MSPAAVLTLCNNSCHQSRSQHPRRPASASGRCPNIWPTACSGDSPRTFSILWLLVGFLQILCIHVPIEELYCLLASDPVSPSPRRHWWSQYPLTPLYIDHINPRCRAINSVIKKKVQCLMAENTWH